VSPDGSLGVVLCDEGNGPTALCYSRRGEELARRGLAELLLTPADGAPVDVYLEPLVGSDRGAIGVTVATRRRRLALSGTYLAATSQQWFRPEGRLTHLLVRDGPTRAWDWDESFLRLLGAGSPPRSLCRWLPHWHPAVPPGSSLTVPRTDWLTPSPGVLEVAGVDRAGTAHWFHFDGRDPANTAARTATASAERVTAACLLGPARVAVTTDRNVVRWLEPHDTALRPRAAVALDVPARVAALAARGGSPAAILADGTALRVELRPRG
jgi:hypothetical protein